MPWSPDMRWVNDYDDEYEPIFRPKKEKEKIKLPKIKEPKAEEAPKPIKAKTKATLIRLEDQRQILCGYDVASLMLEFARVFNAQIYTIAFKEPQEIELLDLDEVAEFISQGKSTQVIPAHEITTILLKQEEKKQEEKKEPKGEITNFMARKLSDTEAAKRFVTMEELVAKFPNVERSILQGYLDSLANKIKSNGHPNIDYSEDCLKVV